MRLIYSGGAGSTKVFNPMFFTEADKPVPHISPAIQPAFHCRTLAVSYLRGFRSHPTTSFSILSEAVARAMGAVALPIGSADTEDEEKYGNSGFKLPAFSVLFWKILDGF